MVAGSRPITLSWEERKVLKWIEDNFPVAGRFDRSSQASWSKAVDGLSKVTSITEKSECRRVFDRLAAQGFVAYSQLSQFTQTDPHDENTQMFKVYITGSGIEYLKTSAPQYRMKEIGIGMVSAPSAIAVVNLVRGTEPGAYIADLGMAAIIGFLIGITWFWLLQKK